jgi:hypothetical protein
VVVQLARSKGVGEKYGVLGNGFILPGVHPGARNNPAPKSPRGSLELRRAGARGEEGES